MVTTGTIKSISILKVMTASHDGVCLMSKLVGVEQESSITHLYPAFYHDFIVG